MFSVAGIYLFKVNNEITEICEIYSKVTTCDIWHTNLLFFKRSASISCWGPNRCKNMQYKR